MSDLVGTRRSADGWRNLSDPSILPPAFYPKISQDTLFCGVFALFRVASNQGGRDVADALQLDNGEQLLRQYYSGRRVESPNGGFLMLLAVRGNDDGSATAIFECTVSSLRYELSIPKATRTERRKVRDVLKEGGDPSCPRHGDGYRLVRAAKQMVCPSCGIGYANV